MSYERPYYVEINYRPLLFYVVFGVKDEELNVSRERHHVDAFPEGLDFVFYNKSEHGEYMASLIGGSLGEILKEDNPALYQAIQNTDTWAVIRGEVQDDADLNYMRNTIGFVQALLETGAIGVLDLQTFSLLTPETWTETVFSKEFDPYDHTVILASETEDGSLWLHTRGMRKFGRPDISMEGVNNDSVDNAVQVINQMIYYGALGAFFSRPTKFNLHTGSSYVVNPQFIDDMENPDFNNSYYRVLWGECKKVE